MNSLWDAFGVSLLSILVAYSVIGITAYLLRTWFSERIRQSIKHDFDLSLERYKGEVARMTTQYSAVQSAANSALIEGQRVSAEWRVKAADAMWRSVLALRDKTNHLLMLLDIFRPEEYQVFVTKSDLRSIVLGLEEAEILSTPEMDQARPFLGEKLYAMTFSYRAIVGRICFLLKWDVQKGHVSPWFQDDGIKRLLREVLAPQEMEQFEGLTRRRVMWMRNLLEAKILDDLRKVIAGTQLVDEGLEQAQRILGMVQTLESLAVDRPRG